MMSSVNEKWVSFGKNFTQKELGGTEQKKAWASNIYTGFSIGIGQFGGKPGAIVSGSPRTTHAPTKFNSPQKVSNIIDIFSTNFLFGYFQMI